MSEWFIFFWSIKLVKERQENWKNCKFFRGTVQSCRIVTRRLILIEISACIETKWQPEICVHFDRAREREFFHMVFHKSLSIFTFLRRAFAYKHEKAVFFIHFFFSLSLSFQNDIVTFDDLSIIQMISLSDFPKRIFRVETGAIYPALEPFY